MSQVFCGIACAIALAADPTSAFAADYTTIDVPGATATYASKIVGRYQEAGGAFHAVLVHNGTFTTIDPPGSGYAQAIGINAPGDIVGGFEPISPPAHFGFLLDKGPFTRFDVPGGDLATDALGINAAGQIVGRYADAASVIRGFLLHRDTFIRIVPPESTFAEAIGINAAGQIVGDYIDAGGVLHGFVLTP
jgi:uncharacterized membrane protein